MAEKSAEEKLKELEGHHEGVKQSLTTLQTKLDAALQKHADDEAACQEKIRAALDKQAKELAAKHAAEIAHLKQTVLIPAQRDLHQRQLADLAAKHAAELNALK